MNESNAADASEDKLMMLLRLAQAGSDKFLKIDLASLMKISGKPIDPLGLIALARLGCTNNLEIDFVTACESAIRAADNVYH